jgi:DNA-binding CsgD family transcriptional regulator
MVLSAQNLSIALLDLYDAAQNKHVTVFPRYALEIIKKLIDFDTAILSLAKSSADGNISSSYVFNYEEDEKINVEYLSIANRDPVLKAIFGAPGKAVCLDVTQSIREHAERDLRDFAQRRHHLHVLAIAPHYSPKHGHLGLSLRRADATWAYLPAESTVLQTLMPHIRESFRVNRTLFSQQVALNCTEPVGGFCIFEVSGVIIYQDTSFQIFMRGVFPDYKVFKMPQPLLQKFLENRQYFQTVGPMVMQANWVGNFCFLFVRAPNKMDVLTQRERGVAQFYGTGLTYKEIGKELSISPSTVRRHIEATYGKLNVNNKADLAFLVNANCNTRSPEKTIANLAPKNLLLM